MLIMLFVSKTGQKPTHAHRSEMFGNTYIYMKAFLEVDAEV